MIFRQLFDSETSTYTYIIADDSKTEGLIIDPVLEQVERDCQIIRELGFQLKYILETHVHADHVTGAKTLKEKFGAEIAYSELSGVDCADILLEDRHQLAIGNLKVLTLQTPGHTNSCCCFYVEDRVFTGDTLMIRGCGRTDFQQGSAEKLFENVHEKLFSLPEETLIYPAHDYKGRTCSSIEEEKHWNPRLNVTKSKEDFVQIMDNLNLAYPKKIDVAVPANLKCGEI